METVYPCIVCGKHVRENRQAVECESCFRWQHRACHTGISRAEYRRAVQGLHELNWRCDPCAIIASSRIGSKQTESKDLVPSATSSPTSSLHGDLVETEKRAMVLNDPENTDSVEDEDADDYSDLSHCSNFNDDSWSEISLNLDGEEEAEGVHVIDVINGVVSRSSCLLQLVGPSSAVQRCGKTMGKKAGVR